MGLTLAAGHIAYATWRALVGHSDLVGFHDTAVYLWNTGELTQSEGWKFYLPGFAVLMLPVMVWPLGIAAAVWATINVALLWWTVRECRRLAKPAPHDTGGFHARWTWPIAAIVVYASSSITLGQFNLPVLALCVLAYTRFARRGQDTWAGVLTGAAAVMKLFPLVLVAFWLLRGRWRASLMALVSFALLAMVPSLAAFGWSGSVKAHAAWLRQVRGEPYALQGAAETSAELPHLMFTRQIHQWMRHNNQSLAAVIRRLTTDVVDDNHFKRSVHMLKLPLTTAYLLYLALAGLVLLALTWNTWHTRATADVPGVFAAWLAAVIAFVPVYWTHYFVLALPTVALLCARAGRLGTRMIASLLLGLWVVGELLTGSRECRLVGVQCWLLLGLMIWALLTRGGPHETAAEPASLPSGLGPTDGRLKL